MRIWVRKPSASWKSKDFPVVVINDMYGGDLYVEGRKKYERGVDS